MKIKALSFRQPWAELVIDGIKTMDLRTWNTHYRGLLAVYASQTIEKEACYEHNIDPDQLTTGAVIGIVDLLNVTKLDERTYNEQSTAHLNARHFRESLYGWKLVNPRRLDNPKPVRGRLNLFDVYLDSGDINEISEGSNSGDLELETISNDELFFGDALPFELRMIPENDPNTGGASYHLDLFQRRVQPPSIQKSLYRQDPKEMDKVVELGGSNLRAVANHVLETLRENGYKATDLNPSRREPFKLEEEWGVRLGLLFLSIKPLSKIDRVELISQGIRDMTSEELYYWYSKCTQKKSGKRAQKALRILLAED